MEECGKGERKGRPFPFLGDKGNLGFQELRKEQDKIQTESRSFCILIHDVIATEELGENFLLLERGDAVAGILHFNAYPVLLSSRTEANATTFGRIFKRIAEKIRENLGEEFPIRLQRDFLVTHNREGLLFRLAFILMR